MPGHAFLWSELTTKDFEGLDPEKTIAILPVAATEQHGPHLPVMTDVAIAEGMLACLKRRLPAHSESGSAGRVAIAENWLKSRPSARHNNPCALNISHRVCDSSIGRACWRLSFVC